MSISLSTAMSCQTHKDMNDYRKVVGKFRKLEKSKISGYNSKGMDHAGVREIRGKNQA